MQLGMVDLPGGFNSPTPRSALTPSRKHAIIPCPQFGRAACTGHPVNPLTVSDARQRPGLKLEVRTVLRYAKISGETSFKFMNNDDIDGELDQHRYSIVER